MPATLHKDVCTSLIISCPVFLRLRHASDKFVQKIKHTHFVFGKVLKKNRAVYGKTCKNVSVPERPQMTTRRMRIASRPPKAKNTHSEYVIHISFPLHQLLHERASTLRYTYNVYLVSC